MYASRIREPLAYTGSLDELDSRDLTPVIGRLFESGQLSQLLQDDTKLRDLAVIVSQRNVVFFRDQDLNIEQQKLLTQKLGELTGKPASSKLHIHAFSNSLRGDVVNGKPDDEVSILDSNTAKRHFDEEIDKFASEGWHSDISTEPIPSDYAVFKMQKLPEGGGGDTLWASGYEVFDRLSAPWKRFAETLSATHRDDMLAEFGKDPNLPMITENRGSPMNKGLDFTVSHPVVRTNPVTGWKSLYGAGGQIAPGWFDNMMPHESDLLKEFFTRLISQNHDLQVRWSWREGDVALWDNRSSFHTATHDYHGHRIAHRVASVGEKPFLDLKSPSRREALHASSNGEEFSVTTGISRGTVHG